MESRPSSNSNGHSMSKPSVSSFLGLLLNPQIHSQKIPKPQPFHFIRLYCHDPALNVYPRFSLPARLAISPTPSSILAASTSALLLRWHFTSRPAMLHHPLQLPLYYRNSGNTSNTARIPACPSAGFSMRVGGLHYGGVVACRYDDFGN